MKVYADNAATTEMSETALAAVIACLQEVYGNASSLHREGRAAAARLEEARGIVAGRLGARPGEIYFTSGGTEADNWALQAAYELGRKERKRHIVSTRVEHHAVLHTLSRLEAAGAEVELLEVDADGLVRPGDAERAIRPDTALVSVMHANNEVGSVQPIEDIARLCRSRGVLFHTDAVQTVGHLSIDATAEGIDLLSLSAHKFHGPKGVGALFCRAGVPLAPFIVGGGQERLRRAGTENVPGIVGTAAALDEMCADMEKNAAFVASLRDLFIAEVERIPNCRINGSRQSRLPGIVNVAFDGVDGETLLLLLDRQEICVSSGSACGSASPEASHVLLAMGLPELLAHSALRLSFSHRNTREEVLYTAEQLAAAVRRLRGAG